MKTLRQICDEAISPDGLDLRDIEPLAMGTMAALDLIEKMKGALALAKKRFVAIDSETNDEAEVACREALAAVKEFEGE